MKASKPRTRTALEPLQKCRTGIQGLDEITGGGLPRGRPTLVCGGPGSGKTLLALEFLVRGALDYKEPGLFVCFEETPRELTHNVASLGFDLRALAARKKFLIDHVLVERSEIEETGEYSLDGLFIRLADGIQTDEYGFSVAPITSVRLDYEVSNERISSGIPRLDTLPGGEGYFRGSAVLVSGTAGGGKTSLAALCAAAACKSGERPDSGHSDPRPETASPGAQNQRRLVECRRGPRGARLETGSGGSDIMNAKSTSRTTAALEAVAAQNDEAPYVLRLYVAGMTPRSVRAINSIKKICEEHLAGRYELAVVDLFQQPVLAKGDQIVATPTLIKQLPAPLRRVMGDLSDVERVLVGLDLKQNSRRSRQT